MYCFSIPVLELRINQCKSQTGFLALAKLTKLKVLELAYSDIREEELIEIVIANKYLQHLNIGKFVNINLLLLLFVFTIYPIGHSVNPAISHNYNLCRFSGHFYIAVICSP